VFLTGRLAARARSKKVVDFFGRVAEGEGMTNLVIQTRLVQTRSGHFFEARLVPEGADATEDAGEVVAYRRTSAEAEDAARVERTRREAAALIIERNLALLSLEPPPVAERRPVGIFRARRPAL